MSQVVDHRPAESSAPPADLASAIQQVLRATEEPLTVAKIKAQLPPALRTLNVEETLQRQVGANVLHEFPKYRSPHARYWDRAMPQHIAVLLRQLLEEEPLAWSDLKRKLPAYAVERGADTVLQEQLAQGKLHRHPKVGSRGGERYGVAQARSEGLFADRIGRGVWTAQAARLQRKPASPGRAGTPPRRGMGLGSGAPGETDPGNAQCGERERAGLNLFI